MAVSTTLLGTSYFTGNYRLEFHAKPSGVTAKLWRDTVKVGTYFLENFQNAEAMTYETLPQAAQSQIFSFLTLHHVQIRRDGVSFIVSRAPPPTESPTLPQIEIFQPFEVNPGDPPHPLGINIDELEEGLGVLHSLQLGPIPPEGVQYQAPPILSDAILDQIRDCMTNPPPRLESYAVEAIVDDFVLFFPRPTPASHLQENNRIVPIITLKGPYDGRLPRLIRYRNSWAVSHGSRDYSRMIGFEKAYFAETQPYLSEAVSSSYIIMGANERIAITADISGSLKIWNINQVDQCEDEIPNVFFCDYLVDDDGNRRIDKLICDDQIVIGTEKIAVLKPSGVLFIWDLPTRALSHSLSLEQVLQYNLAFRDIDGDDTLFTNFSFHDDRILIESLKKLERTGHFVQQLYHLEFDPLSMRQHLFAPKERFLRMHQGRVFTIFDQSLYFSELCSNAPRTLFMQLGFDVKRSYHCANKVVFISTAKTIHIVDLIQRIKTDLVTPGLDLNDELIWEVEMVGGKLMFLESRAVQFNIHLLDLAPPPTTGADANVAGPSSSYS